jgi:hypothetical protein
VCDANQARNVNLERSREAGQRPIAYALCSTSCPSSEDAPGPYSYLVFRVWLRPAGKTLAKQCSMDQARGGSPPQADLRLGQRDCPSPARNTLCPSAGAFFPKSVTAHLTMAAGPTGRIAPIAAIHGGFSTGRQELLDGPFRLPHNSCGGLTKPSKPCWRLGGINRCSMLGRQLCQRLAPGRHIGVTCGGSRTPMVGRCSHERRLIRSMGR